MKTGNPYVGPRAFRANETLPNREREAFDLANLVMAERVVLLHSPSGAGKTSLIQSAVLNQLKAEGFAPTTALRIECPRPPDVSAANRYTFSLALDLLGGKGLSPAELAGFSLCEILTMVPWEDGRRVLVIDQFEEILTLDSTDIDVKVDFFQQLGKAIADCDLWALFAMREDYLGALDRFLRFLPGHLRATYRLDFFSREEALAAVQNPARARGVDFTDPAANALVDLLAGNGLVEPFQLQVVCRQIWRDRKKDSAVIDMTDVEETDIDSALGKFYSRAMEAVSEYGADERVVRDWCEEELISVAGYRTQTMSGPAVGDAGLDTKVLRILEEMHFIRSDRRANTTWYELAHDSLVNPVREDNRAWQLSNLQSWQVAAYEWKRRNRNPGFLLPTSKLSYAPLSGSHLLDHERDFLRQSSMAAGSASRARYTVFAPRVVVPVLSVFEFVIIVLLLVLR